MPEREMFWNIGAWGNIVYVLSAIGLVVFILAVYRRYQLWRSGKSINRFDHLGLRIRTLVTDILSNKRILKEPWAGVLHLITFWGFVSLFLLAAADFIDHYIFHFLKGDLYLVFSLVVEILALLALFALLGVTFKRYLIKKDRRDNRHVDAIALILLFLLLFTGFIVEANRLAASIMITNPDQAPWSLGGWVFGQIFIKLSPSTNEVIHKITWSVHLGLFIAAIFYVGLSFSKLVHIILSPVNIFLKKLEPKGQLPVIDFENTTHYGVNQIHDFIWKQLLDLDACTRCGRCQDNCPASLSGKILSPLKVTQDLKAHMERAWSPISIYKDGKNLNGAGEPSPLVDMVVSSEALWDCTTCGACEESCPIYVEHVGRLIDLRRNIILNGMPVPDEIQAILRNMEIRGHPWRGTEYIRDDWAKSLGVKTLSDYGQAEWLFFVGCTGALVDRNVAVTTSLAQILISSGIDFAILGKEEGCCGDPARRIGQELMFQLMVQQNIELFEKYGVRKIVTSCPHCFQSLKHEYPQLGGEFEVWHHSQLIELLIKNKRLEITKPVSKLVTYHDPCYLGRYNGVLEPPRTALKEIPGLQLIEIARCRERSFCCGAGGGHCWMNEPVGRRINQMRLDQATETKAEVLSVACPFCLQMMEDAIASLESPIKAMDISELIVQSISFQHTRHNKPLAALIGDEGSCHNVL